MKTCLPSRFSQLAPLAVIATALSTVLTPSRLPAADALSDFVEIATLRDQKKNEPLIWACQTFLANHAKTVAAANVRYYLAQALFDSKKYDAAISESTELLKQKPDTELKEQITMLRGEAHRNLQNYEESIPDFRAAYELSRAGDSTLAAHAQYHVIQALHYLKRPKEAEKEFRLLEKNHPSANYVRSAAALLKIKTTATSRPAAESGPKAGETAPEIEFVQLDNGKSRRLTEFKGKVVVVDFWASWCGPCQTPMAKMQTYREKHPEWADKVELIALSIDNTREEARQHLSRKGWNKTFNAWAGEGGFRSPPPTKYSVRGIPKVFVIDQSGKVAASGHPMSMDIPAIIGKLLAK